MDDTIIISPAAEPLPPEKPATSGDIAARIAQISGGALIIGGLIGFAGFGLYPLFSGQGLREFFISLIVPFLISLIAVVPGALLYCTAKHVLTCGPGYGPGAIAAVLSLPPLVFAAFILPRLGVTDFASRAACGIAGALLFIWGLSLIRGRYKRQDKARIT